MNAIEAIAHRRSISRLSEPAPSQAELTTILEAAVLAPDHKELRPWRFIILAGQQKDLFNEVMVAALLARDPEASEGKIEKERHKLDRAPIVIVAATKRIESKLPFSEMVASTSAAVQNMLLAATELGYGSIWRSGAGIYDPNVKAALGLSPDDEINGFVYLGTAPDGPPPAKAPVTADVVTVWAG